ncbi:MAG: RsmE family RNA methyltransferase [Minisyncoccia bacterium]
MRQIRFYYFFSSSEKKIIIKDKEIIHQARNVLRLKKGDGVILFNEKTEWRGRINLICKDFIEVFLEEEIGFLKEPKNYVRLFASILKRENFEILVQKATEIGIKEICPLICQRTVKLNFKEERLKKIIKEAAEQSGRRSLAVLYPPFKFEDSLDFIDKNDINLFFDLEGKKFQKILKNIPLKSKKINIFIGPEGGWSEEEKEKAKEKKFFIIKLSDLSFRSETAGIIASYLSVYFNEFFP